MVVIGAGAAGMAAALAAAREQADVYLVDRNAAPGGTVGHALIHTIAGIYDASARPLNGGLVRELVDRLTRASDNVCQRRIGKLWTLMVSPELYTRQVQHWLGEQPKLIPLWNTRLVRVAGRGGRITELETAGPAGSMTLRARSVVDASGSAEVARRLEPSLLCDDERRAAGGLIFRMRGVAPGSLAFPKGLQIVRAMREAAGGELPACCRNAWIDTGLEPDEAYVKLFVPLEGDWWEREQRGEVSRLAGAVQRQAAEFLKRFPSFAEARVDRVGQLGIRDGGRVCGEYRLTEDDVRAGRKFDDAVCRCDWPIEYWHPLEGLQLEYLKEGRCYEIPLRSLKVKNVDNLWTAGKCLSADPRAQASARVAGTCWAMGEAAGKAAARF